MKKMITTLVFALCTIASAANAHAGDFAFSVGRDLGAINFTGAKEVTNVGTRLGYLGGRIHIFGTVDLGRYELTTDYKSPDFNNVERGGALYTVGAGVRYFFNDPEASEAIPYLIAGGYTVIPWVKQDKDDPIANATSASSGGFMAGFGAEYFLDERFSIGGELGFNGFFAQFTNQDAKRYGQLLQLYSGVQLNFYL